MDGDRYFIEVTAYHEAGHAVVAWNLGARLLEIVIDVADGICKHNRLINFLLDPEIMSDFQWRRAEKYAQILLGGEMAERVFEPSSKHTDFDGDSDRRELNDLASMLFPGSESAATEWIANMETRSEQIVREQWNALETLACELIVHRRLSGDAAIGILQGVGLAAPIRTSYTTINT